MKSVIAVAGLLMLAVGIQATGQVRVTHGPTPSQTRHLDRHIHGAAAEFNGRIVFVCETRPREYCSADGQECWIEADLYISETACPTIRIK